MEPIIYNPNDLDNVNNFGKYIRENIGNIFVFKGVLSGLNEEEGNAVEEFGDPQDYCKLLFGLPKSQDKVNYIIITKPTAAESNTWIKGGLDPEMGLETTIVAVQKEDMFLYKLTTAQLSLDKTKFRELHKLVNESDDTLGGTKVMSGITTRTIIADSLLLAACNHPPQ